MPDSVVESMGVKLSSFVIIVTKNGFYVIKPLE